MKKVGNKVVAVGTSSADISYAHSILNQALRDNSVLIDFNHKRVGGEVRDFRHGISYAASLTRTYVGDYGDCPDADIVCICAGLSQRPGEMRLDLIDNNLRVLHSIVTAVMASGLSGIFLVATNPVDVLSYAAWRFSGPPRERVIGSGTIIDSACFYSYLGNEFNVAPWSVDAMMIDEHGGSVIAVRSTANVSGMSMKKILGQEGGGKARMEKTYSNVRNAAYEAVEARGSTSYDISMDLSHISNAILHNQDVVLPVSSLLEGEFRQGNVYIGVPAVVSRQSVVCIINLGLFDDEVEQFARSAELLKSYQQKVDGFMVAR